VDAGNQTLLFDPRMQLLAGLLLTGGLSEFLPSSDDETVVRYMEVERLTGDEPTAVRNLLENLASGGILERRFVKRLISCPNCSSTHSQKPVDSPQSYHLCETCGRSFAIERTVLTDVYAYKLSKDAESQLTGERSPLKPLEESLVGCGYDVTIGGIVQGASGTKHWFNVVAVRESDAGKDTIVVDLVAADSLVGVNPVLILFAKRYDVDANKSVLIAMPGIMETGRKLASMYGITLIEASNIAEAAHKLRQSLSP